MRIVTLFAIAAALELIDAAPALSQASSLFPADKKARVGGTFYLQPVRGIAVTVCPDLAQKNHLECPKQQYGKFTIEALEQGLGDIAYRVRFATGKTGYIRAYQEAFFSLGDTSSAENKKKNECERRGYPRLGMTVPQVRATCWGDKYHKVNRTITAAGTREQHVYPYQSRTAEAVYLYFDNGILTAIQD